MIEASSARNIDPSLLEPAHEQEFADIITFTVGILERAETITYIYENIDPTAEEETVSDLDQEKRPGGISPSELREMTHSGIGSTGELIALLRGDGKTEVTRDEYEEAYRQNQEASPILIDHTAAYQQYMRKNLAIAYGEPEENPEVVEDSWRATWKKLYRILMVEDGTLLSSAAGFFDDIVREKYGESYKEDQPDRGPAVSMDLGAKTFYEVMGELLNVAAPRAAENV